MTTKYAGAEWLQSRVDYPLSPLAKKVAFIMGVVFGGLYNWEDCHKMAGWRSESVILLPLDFQLTAGIFCPSLSALVIECHRCGVEVSLPFGRRDQTTYMRFVDAPELLGIADLLTAME